MRVPERLEPLLEQGVLDEVLRPLQSGKEAQVYLVEARGERCVAKVYKEAEHRSFKHRADYVEGRRARGSREQRAMSRRSRFGREQIEEAWRNAEVDALGRLEVAGVRVPRTLDYVDGVLVMELVVDDHGEPAPRLCDVALEEREALDLFHVVLQDVVRMLCAGLVHGDLSDFNILMGADGPVIIDFPQAVDAAANQSARKLLVRDVKNLTRFFGRWAPKLLGRKYGEEMWELYEHGQLDPETRLTGKWKAASHQADVWALLREIEDVEREARARREALGLPVRPARAPVEFEAPAPAPAAPEGGGGGSRRRKRKKGRGPAEGRPAAPARAERTEPSRPSRDDDLDRFLLVDD